MTTNSSNHSEFVLRLLVVKVEGVLVPPLSDWSGNLPDGAGPLDITGDELFPDWVRASSVGESELRESLVNLASSGYFELNESVGRLIEYAHDHSPIRVALLSSGPDQWLGTLVENLGISDQVDLPYSFDRYTHGNRRTLLQFLMNRFIAGRERTLLLGRTPADERLADREQTRFRSLQPAPEDAINPDNWDWDTDRLLEFMKEKQPQE